jgi:hypothetical protein
LGPSISQVSPNESRNNAQFLRVVEEIKAPVDIGFAQTLIADLPKVILERVMNRDYPIL